MIRERSSGLILSYLQELSELIDFAGLRFADATVDGVRLQNAMVDLSRAHRHLLDLLDVLIPDHAGEEAEEED